MARDDDDDPTIEVTETTPDGSAKARTKAASWARRTPEATIASPRPDERSAYTMPEIPAYILPRAPQTFISVFRMRQSLARRANRR